MDLLFILYLTTSSWNQHLIQPVIHFEYCFEMFSWYSVEYNYNSASTLSLGSDTTFNLPSNVLLRRFLGNSHFNTKFCLLFFEGYLETLLGNSHLIEPLTDLTLVNKYWFSRNWHLTNWQNRKTRVYPFNKDNCT